MILLRSLRRLRLGAALLAALGVLVMPARQLLACPMLGGEDRAPTSHAEHAEHSAHDSHAAHADEAAQSPDRELRRGGSIPEHERCPDLAHCAVAALSAEADELPAALELEHEPGAAAPGVPSSVHGALEPPPPKRG